MTSSASACPHTTPLRTGRTAVNGTSLHYRTTGAGPAVVLLHGVPKTGYHCRHLVPRLTPHHTVVVPDLRGLGDSARAGHERELITYVIRNERSHPDTPPDAVEEYVRCYSTPGGIRAMLAVYRAMLNDAEQNRQAARRKLDIPVLTLGGSAFIGARNEDQARLVAHDVTGHVFNAGHDLAEEDPTRWPTWSCRSWRPTTDRRPSTPHKVPRALLRPCEGGGR